MKAIPPRVDPRRKTSKPKVADVRARGTAVNQLSTEELAILIPVDKPLTEMQRRFAENVARGDTPNNAAIRAGYATDSNAYLTLKMPNVKAQIGRLTAVAEAEAQMTRKKVMDMHLEAFEMSKLMSEPSSMVAAAREIGKICGYYAPVEHRVKVDISGNIVLDRLNSLTDAELLKIISEGNRNDNSPALLPDFSGDSVDEVAGFEP